MNKATMSTSAYAAGQRKMLAKHAKRKHRNKLTNVPENEIEKKVERLIRLFNRETEALSDQTRCAVAQLLSKKLSYIDAGENDGVNGW